MSVWVQVTSITNWWALTSVVEMASSTVRPFNLVPPSPGGPRLRPVPTTVRRRWSRGGLAGCLRRPGNHARAGRPRRCGKPLGPAGQGDGLAGATVAAGPAVPGVLLAAPPQLATHPQVSAYTSAKRLATRVRASSAIVAQPPHLRGA